MRKIDLLTPTDTPIKFKLGHTAADIHRRMEREEEGEKVFPHEDI